MTVNRVCRNCNHGWMEQEIEAPNQKLLPQLFLGQTTALVPDEQTVVATWAIKTHLIAQYQHVPFRAPRVEHLQWLYEHKTPPEACRVWLGAFAGEPRHRAWGRTSDFKLVPPADESLRDPQDGAAMTLCIGQLVLQTFQSSGPVDFDIRPTSALAELVVRIWPASNRAVHWPPAAVVQDQTNLRKFSDGFVTGISSS